VIGHAGVDRHHNRLYLCRCQCGVEKIITGTNLRRGNTKSCGCLRREQRLTHGLTRSPTYMSWATMRQRCNNPRATHYERYGGRGITVCDRWEGPQGLANFVEDLGERPDGTTLDRYPDPNGNYAPGNCRWATRREQTANQSRRGDTRVTHCANGHRFTASNTYDNTYDHRDGTRSCRTCRKAASRANNEATRKPCRGCGGPKPHGRGVTYCDDCRRDAIRSER